MTQWCFANVISISIGQRLCQTLKNSVNILLDHMAFCEWGNVHECGWHNLFPIEFTLHKNSRSSWRLVICALIFDKNRCCSRWLQRLCTSLKKNFHIMLLSHMTFSRMRCWMYLNVWFTQRKLRSSCHFLVLDDVSTIFDSEGSPVLLHLPPSWLPESTSYSLCLVGSILPFHFAAVLLSVRLFDTFNRLLNGRFRQSMLSTRYQIVAIGSNLYRTWFPSSKDSANFWRIRKHSVRHMTFSGQGGCVRMCGFVWMF